MAIGKVQRSPGNEVYLWAQDCMKLDDKALASDLRFPRLDREIAAKLIKVCRSGRFGLLFQQMVESERMSTGGMPNGRCMLRAIFRHFQLEKDRIGMLAERNLLNIRLGGGSIAELITFRDKYLYVMTTIPLDDKPRETTLFNHLIDELDKCPTLKAKVEKAREAGPSSHRRTTEWLWKRVDIAIELHQQKINRQEFDRTLQAKPEVLTSTTTQKPNVPANPAKPDAQPKGDKPTKEKKEKKRKEKRKRTRMAKMKCRPLLPLTPLGPLGPLGPLRVRVIRVKAKAKAKAKATPPLAHSRHKAPRTCLQRRRPEHRACSTPMARADQISVLFCTTTPTSIRAQSPSRSPRQSRRPKLRPMPPLPQSSQPCPRRP